MKKKKKGKYIWNIRNKYLVKIAKNKTLQTKIDNMIDDDNNNIGSEKQIE